MMKAETDRNVAMASMIGLDAEDTIYACSNVSAFLAEALHAFGEVKGVDFTEEARHGAGTIAYKVAAALAYEEANWTPGAGRRRTAESPASS